MANSNIPKDPVMLLRAMTGYLCLKYPIDICRLILYCKST